MSVSELEIRPELDRSRGLTTEITDEEHPCALNITIDHKVDGYHIKVLPHPAYAHLFSVTETRLPITQAQLWGYVSDCTSVWRNRVVTYKTSFVNFFPFQEKTEKPLSLLGLRLPMVYSRMMEKLALAGRTLFVQIFRPTERGYEEVQKIGDALEALSKIQNLWIKITSRDFYAPWNLLYLANDFDKPRREGFWGYQHVIAHNPAENSQSRKIFKPKFDVALHLDLEIDKQPGDFKGITKVVQLLRSYETGALAERNTREDFLNQLRKGTHEDFFYFCCHGLTEGDEGPGFGKSRLRLTDIRTEEEKEGEGQEEIGPGDVAVYMNGAKWTTRPIVFLNCCQLTKMNSIFYEGFAATFLNHDAIAVIGPHIEIPTVFARDFAKAFFEEFFQGGRDRSIGHVLLKLRRQFLDTHENPLGLAYLLYSGADSYVQSPVLRRNIQE